MIVGNRSDGSGKWTVGVWDKLNVNGDLNMTGSIKIGGAVLSWDSANNKLVINKDVTVDGRNC